MATVLRATSWDTRIALDDYLRGEPSSIILDPDRTAGRKYYSFSTNRNHGRLSIGVVTAGLGTEPLAVLWDQGHRVLVGHDFLLTWIDLSNANVVSTLPLSGVVYDFIALPEEDEIIVVHEIGVVRVNSSGIARWSVDTDIIQDAHVDADGDLAVTQFDGPPLKISMSSGSVLNREAHKC